ncbi:MAG: metabolite traffic protein EboE [Planctomycetes bacterium]|nr:metabolite traffic protein EboE [Planctomycetota bacterium]
MPEIRAAGRVFRLAYSMNVHPGESAADLERAVREGPAVLRRKLFTEQRAGAGLRLANRAATELAEDPARLKALAQLLEDEKLFAFTANAFPYGDFHGDRVKEQVYRPSWADRSRLAYTMAAAHVLASLGGGAQVTLSTVAGGYRADGDDRQAKEEMSRNLAQAAAALHTLRLETGVSVRLCLEPEPLTTVETTADVIEFFRRFVYPGGERALQGTAKYNMGQASDILHEHLGICYDCCHQAVLWEDPADSLDRIERSGIPIGKVQLTCALEGDPRELAKVAEPRYFHQVAAPGGKRADDLEFLGEDWKGVSVARSHYHVPIFLESFGALRTTRGFLEGALGEIVKRGLCADLEIETYTWDVIPEGERKRVCGGTLVESLEKEYGWVLAQLAVQGPAQV